ncbi:hypothetical protein GF325_14705 [Candidatus Bathyarchaeota archaeon]|nr:hypothetical protein [Candidatus Bathyarchaeota archaeon]
MEMLQEALDYLQARGLLQPIIDRAAAGKLARDGIQTKVIKQFKRPVIIMAGSTSPATSLDLNTMNDMLQEAFSRYSGTIISGGTKAGICELAGNLQAVHGDQLETIGYLPAELPLGTIPDERYTFLRRTTGSIFSCLEPLQYWHDIVKNSILPKEVKIIGIGGGRISRFEYLLGAAIGAKVGLVEGTGGCVDEILGLDLCDTVRLDHDGSLITKFIQSRTCNTPRS